METEHKERVEVWINEADAMLEGIATMKLLELLEVDRAGAQIAAARYKLEEARRELWERR